MEQFSGKMDLQTLRFALNHHLHNNGYSYYTLAKLRVCRPDESFVCTLAGNYPEEAFETKVTAFIRANMHSDLVMHPLIHLVKPVEFGKDAQKKFCFTGFESTTIPKEGIDRKDLVDLVKNNASCKFAYCDETGVHTALDKSIEGCYNKFWHKLLNCTRDGLIEASANAKSIDMPKLRRQSFERMMDQISREKTWGPIVEPSL